MTEVSERGTPAFQIFVISDGTGGTAEQMLRAALTQFTGTEFQIHRFPEVRTEEQVLEIVEEAVRVQSFIVHTVVSAEMRSRIADLGRLHNIETIDLMGPLLAQLTYQFSDAPSGKPGLFRKLNKEYFQRIEAMEFAFRHDDGQRAKELSGADLVLTGVSRTFKTPLSIYLAFKGWLVGNVPIISDIPPPPSMFDLPEGIVFCLTTNANHLSVLRSVRHEHLGGSTGDYANVDFIRKELAYANQIFRRRPDWPIIDVTKKPIEEIAAQILARKRSFKTVKSD
ncbi:MAG: kinase/pyrophosphorylase [Bacteroidetes bacterium]|nr:MAG: kinase/pyrophosphorylase [Bacteroidota bacterium]